MNTSAELYEVNLVSSSKLKLRATARLAEGTEDAVFEACVLFHAAARQEGKAVDALSSCPPETRLAGSIEECWCLVEGRDPPAAADVWSRILDEVKEVDHATAESMLSRLRPRYDLAIRDFVRAFVDYPALQLSGQSQILVPSSRSERTAAMREVRAALKRFPGVPGFWWIGYRLSEATNNAGQAWSDIRQALALAPDDARFRAITLITAAQALGPAEADQYLGQAHAGLHKAEAEVALMYAYAEIALARRSPTRRSERWARALKAVNDAFPKTHSVWLTRNLQGLRLFLEAEIGKRKVDPNLLYHAGLGRLAVTSNRDPIDALRADATARVGAMGSDAAA